MVMGDTKAYDEPVGTSKDIDWITNIGGITPSVKESKTRKNFQCHYDSTERHAEGAMNITVRYNICV